MEILSIILTFIGFVGGAFVILVSIHQAFEHNCYPVKCVKDVIIGIVLPILSLIIMIGSVCYASNIYEQHEQKFYKSIADYVNNEGYIIYINGTEIDLAHITIENYPTKNISIKEDIKEIHISAIKWGEIFIWVLL